MRTVDDDAGSFVPYMIDRMDNFKLCSRFARTSSFLSLMYRDHFSDMHISISVSCSSLNTSVVNGRGETQSLTL